MDRSKANIADSTEPLPSDDGVRLIKASKKLLKVDDTEDATMGHRSNETARDRIMNKRWRERKNEEKIPDDSEKNSEKKRIREAAVSMDWIVKQAS